MTNTDAIEIALKERMIIDSIIILATVEFIQKKIEKKLLDIDDLRSDYNFEQVSEIKNQVIELLSKLRREETRMDEFMTKYRLLINEKKAFLSSYRKEKPIYLRGVSTYTTRQKRRN